VNVAAADFYNHTKTNKRERQDVSTSAIGSDAHGERARALTLGETRELEAVSAVETLNVLVVITLLPATLRHAVAHILLDTPGAGNIEHGGSILTTWLQKPQQRRQQRVRE
jgi:hypothetical protein